MLLHNLFTSLIHSRVNIKSILYQQRICNVYAVVWFMWYKRKRFLWDCQEIECNSFVVYSSDYIATTKLRTGKIHLCSLHECRDKCHRVTHMQPIYIINGLFNNFLIVFVVGYCLLHNNSHISSIHRIEFIQLFHISHISILEKNLRS